MEGYVYVLVSVVITVLLLRYYRLFKKLGKYGYLGLFALSVLGHATVIFPLPVLAVVFIAGKTLNPLLSALVAAAGASIGELNGYMLGYGGQSMVDSETLHEKVLPLLQKYGFFALVFFAAIPSPFFDMFAIVSGSLKYSISTFLLATFLGKFIKLYFVASLGRFL